MNFKILKYIFTLLITFPLSAFAFEGEENTYAQLLISGNNAQIILGAQSVYYENSTNTELLDIVAEVLLNGSIDQSYISSDGLSWLAKALGHSKLTRYENVLKSVDAKMSILEAKYKPLDKSDEEDNYEEDESRPENKNIESRRPTVGFFSNSSVYSSYIDDIHTEVDHSKVRDYIADALERLTDTSQDNFEAGKIDYKATLKKINTSKKANIANKKTIAFANIKRGSYMGDVYAQNGLPDSPSVYYVKKHKAFIGRVVLARLQVIYGDQGIVQFMRENDDRPGWYVYKVYSFEPDGLKIGLLTEDARQLKRYASGMYHAYMTDTNILDIATKRIWGSMDTEDGRMGDSLAWLTKVIGRSRNSRYLTAMKDISENAKNKKVRQYARKQIELLTFGSEQQFVKYK